MDFNCECNVQYIPYKEIIKQKARDHYHKNKEKMKERNKIKYDSLSPEQKRKRQAYHKEWFNKKTNEKQEELREKARQYHKNSYRNLMVAVK